MILILYTQDHAARGSTLSSVLPGSKHGLVSIKPTKFEGMDTLTFWGHGDFAGFCDLTPSELVKLIGKWKSLNAKLKTVELITCNARHTYAGDPLADKIKSALRRGILQGTSGLVVKALPVTVTGKMNAWSILLAETTHRSWVYVTAPGKTDALMMQAQNLVRYEIGPSGGAESFNGDMAAKADRIVRETPDREWTMNYGYFNALRNNLVVVK